MGALPRWMGSQGQSMLGTPPLEMGRPTTGQMKGSWARSTLAEMGMGPMAPRKGSRAAERRWGSEVLFLRRRRVWPAMS